VEIRQQGAQIIATVDGRAYELEMMPGPDRAYLMRHNGAVFDCRVDGRLESGATVDVIVGAHRHAITLIDPKRLRGASGAGGQGEGAARMIAPMPGKVVRVLVEAGQEVAAGDGIVVVEAMKMQNEMKSPKQGKVAALSVAVGATVNGGDLLAVIE